MRFLLCLNPSMGGRSIGVFRSSINLNEKEDNLEEQSKCWNLNIILYEFLQEFRFFLCILLTENC